MDDRLKNNVQTLLDIIEEDMKANEVEMTEKIPSFIQDYNKKFNELNQENTTLEAQLTTVTVEYNESKHSETELTKEHQKLAQEIEEKIMNHNQTAQENTQKLTKLMSELQVLKSKCDGLQNKITIN